VILYILETNVNARETFSMHIDEILVLLAKAREDALKVTTNGDTVKMKENMNTLLSRVVATGSE
jgi:hypothetical protein